VRVDNAICTFHNGATTSGIGIKLLARASYAFLQINGKEVFRFAARAVPQVIEAALQEAGLRGTDLDWLLLHQVKKLGLGVFFFWQDCEVEVLFGGKQWDDELRISLYGLPCWENEGADMKTCYFSGCRLIKELLTRFHSNLRYQHPK
jgi:hypothetical protein